MKITARDNNGSIIIRFTISGVKYSLSQLGKYASPQALCTANYICQNIESDIHMGRFTCRDSGDLFYAYHPWGADEKARKEAAKVRSAQQILTSLDSFANPLNAGLRQCRTLLEKYGEGVVTTAHAQNFVNWLNDGSRKPQSINRYLNVLKPVCPMFADIKRLKATQAKEEEPFSFEEIHSILKSFDENYSHYSDFVRFLFSTGCRPSEAAAFSFDDINLKRNTITIRSAIARDLTGSKEIKGTKTGVLRTFPIGDKLVKILSDRQLDASSLDTTNLVFTSPRGCIIDVNSFRWNYWKPALEKAGVDYRCVYNTRHTFISHYIEKYKDYQKCAAITHGTKAAVKTIIEHYSHLVSAIETLDLF